MLASASVQSKQIARTLLAPLATSLLAPVPCCPQASSRLGYRCIHNLHAGPSSRPLESCQGLHRATDGVSLRQRRGDRSSRRPRRPESSRSFSSATANPPPSGQFHTPPSEHAEQRFLPPQILESIKNSSLRHSEAAGRLHHSPSHPSPALSRPQHPLEDALDRRGLSAAWQVYKSHTVDDDFSIPRYLIDRLWWTIAVRVEILPQPTNEFLEDSLDRLASIWNDVDRRAESCHDGISAISAPFMDTLKSHRWLYLLVTRIVSSSTSKRVGTMQRGPYYLNPLRGQLHHRLFELLRHMRVHRQLIDTGLLPRVLMAMSLSGRPVESLALWEEQQTLRKLQRDTAEESSLPLLPLPSNVIETWLDCLANAVSSSDHSAAAVDPPAESSLVPATMASSALRVIDLAIEASSTLNKRPLSHWLKKLDSATLGRMLPEDVQAAIPTLKHQWLNSIAQPTSDSSSTADAVIPRLTDEHRHILAELIAFELANRGVLRAAVAMNDSAMAAAAEPASAPFNRDLRNVREALLRGIGGHVGKLLGPQAQATASKAALEEAKDGAHYALKTYQAFRKSAVGGPHSLRIATNNVINVLSIVIGSQQDTERRALSSQRRKHSWQIWQTRQRFPRLLQEKKEGFLEQKQAVPDSLSQWTLPLRHFTTTVLAADPQLSRVLTPVTLSKLLKLHASMQDYNFTKDLWLRWQKQDAQRDLLLRQDDNEAAVLGPKPAASPPLLGSQFAWFFQQTLNRPRVHNIVFAVQILLDWQAYLDAGKNARQHPADANAEPFVPSHLCVKLLTRLAAVGLTHILRRSMIDFQHNQIRVTQSMCKAFVAAFRSPVPFAAEQSIGIVSDLTRLFQEQQEAARSTTTYDSDAPSEPSGGEHHHHLPLEMFMHPMAQVTSSQFSVWNGTWHAKSLNLFQHFASQLEQEIALRGTKPFNDASLVRISESTVRSAFNSAMRTFLDWPQISLIRAGVRSMPSRQVNPASGSDRGVSSPARGNNRTSSSLGRGLRSVIKHVKRNTDLVSSPTEQQSSDHQTMTSSNDLGDARRAALLHMLSILDHKLDVQGDWESWSLRLLSWMLPSGSLSWKDRKTEALKVWQASLGAVFDANQRTELKPWARFSVADLHSQDVVSINGTGASRPGDVRSSVSSSTAMVRPVLIRPWIAARFMLNLATHHDENAADIVFTEYVEKANEIQDMYLGEQSQAEQGSAMSPPVSTDPERAVLDIKGRFRSLLWEDLTIIRHQARNADEGEDQDERQKALAAVKHFAHYAPEFPDVIDDSIGIMKGARAVDLIWRLDRGSASSSDMEGEARRCWIESGQSAMASVDVEDLDALDQAWRSFKRDVLVMKPEWKQNRPPSFDDTFFDSKGVVQENKAKRWVADSIAEEKDQPQQSRTRDQGLDRWVHTEAGGK